MAKNFEQIADEVEENTRELYSYKDKIQVMLHRLEIVYWMKFESLCPSVSKRVSQMNGRGNEKTVTCLTFTFNVLVNDEALFPHKRIHTKWNSSVSMSQ